MAFLSSLSADDICCYNHTVVQSVRVRSHFDLLIWLQGDMQRYLPHEILIAAWGDFQSGAIHLDVLSALAGVRSQNSNLDTIKPLLLQLFGRWVAGAKEPFALNAVDSCFLLGDSRLHSELGDALQDMGCAMVHGIADERNSHDCLYVIFSPKDCYSAPELSAMSLVLPYVDAALRKVKHLANQSPPVPSQSKTPNGNAHPPQPHDLSDREVEILKWVTLGKTNPEIGSILEISEFTVKNHLQRVFKKLHVYNRAQAVGKFNVMMGNV